MHLHPNITDLPSKLWTAAKQVPLVVGELGQENPGASALDPQYVKNTIAGALSTGIPNGHNGLFAWIWAWCDTNTMLQDVWDDANGQPRNEGYDADSPLTSHGMLWRDNYYNKVIAPPVSTPVSTPVAPLPTATSQPSATPRPSATIAPTTRPTGTAMPACDHVIERDYKIDGRQAHEVACVTLG